jgi:membrane-associated HD superfamily phosphohydrolase
VQIYNFVKKGGDKGLKNKNLFIKVMLCLLVICATSFILVNVSGGEGDNAMGLILIGFPIFTFIAALIMQLLINKKIIILSMVFLAYLIGTFVIFNSTFLIWCFVYTAIALIGTLVADLVHFIGVKLINKM